MSLRAKFLVQQLILLAGLSTAGLTAILGLTRARGLVAEGAQAQQRQQMAANTRSAIESFVEATNEPFPRLAPSLLSDAIESMRRLIGQADGLDVDDVPPFAAVALDRLQQARAAAVRAQETAVAPTTQPAPPATQPAPPATQPAPPATQPAPPATEPAGQSAVDDARSHALDALVPAQLVAQYYLSRTVEVQTQADDLVRRTIVTLTGLTLASALLTLAVASWQYAGVMNPLAALRDGVHRLTRRQFDRPLEIGGDAEMAALADDFNHMAGRLEGFYTSLEEQVAAKSRELVRSERLASVGFLAAGVAHEINNPLGIISGYAELALRKIERNPGQPVEPAAIGPSLEAIRDEAFRCKQITQRLLSLARGGEEDRVRIDMADVAHDVASLVGVLRKFGDRTLETPIEQSRPLPVLAHPGEMKQVLMNLIINAMDFTPPHTGRVRISGRIDDGQVVVEVADNGRGMTPAVLERVFEPFFTDRPPDPDRTPDDRGVGLGLSISLAIVENHGGHLAATSPGPGRGSVFTLRLPLAKERTEP